MSAIGTKRTSACALHMSAFDPKRTLAGQDPLLPPSGLLSFPAETCGVLGGGCVRRRDFIRVIAGSAVGWPLAAQGRKPDQIRRVSVLLGTPENDPETKTRIRAFRLGMRDAGWVEGSNIQIEYRHAGIDSDAISKHVAEAIRLAPDVIVANSTPVMAALRPATNTVPIIFVLVNDPVGQGFVSNLKRPGSNVTGFSFIDPEIVGKWIESAE